MKSNAQHNRQDQPASQHHVAYIDVQYREEMDMAMRWFDSRVISPQVVPIIKNWNRPGGKNLVKMEAFQEQLVLDKLAPIEAIKPVRNNVLKCTILDDTTAAATYEDVAYINRCRDADRRNNEILREGTTHDGTGGGQGDQNTFTEGLRYFASKQDIMTDVTNLGFWKVSTSRPGNGIYNALNDNPMTFWQSDGGQPHEIRVVFGMVLDISLVAIYLSLDADESYTPRLFKIYAGHGPADAELYKTFVVERMNGWLGIRFSDNRHDSKLRCQYIKLVFPINHENGKDTRVRGIRVFARPDKPNADEVSMPVRNGGFPNLSGKDLLIR